MKKVCTLNTLVVSTCILIGIGYYTILIIGNCQALYTRTFHALKLRSKYRRCVEMLHALKKETSTTQEESPLIECATEIVWREKSEHVTENDTKAITKKPTDNLPQTIHNASVMKLPPPTTPFVKKNIPPLCPFAWPLKKGTFWLSSLFGPRKRPNGSDGFHTGIDLAALKGTPVYAPRAGLVIKAYYADGYGKTIVLQHGKKFKTRYAHLDKIHVAPGDWVPKNFIIGEVGDTGFVRKEGKDGSHLHFEVYEYEKRVNPMQFLPELV